MLVRLSVRTRARSLATTTVAASVALACVAGCSSSTTASSSTGSSGGSDSSTNTDSGLAYAKAQLTKYEATRNTFAAIGTVANVPDLKGKTVWYIPIGNSVPILSTIGSGMSAALKTLGANVHVCDGNFLPTTIAGCMNTAANQSADAVVTGFVDYALIPTAFNNLVSHHIPVLVGGEQPSGGRTTDKTLAFFDVSAESQQAFKLMSDAIISDSNGSAESLVVRLTDSSLTTTNSDLGIKELKQYCAKCKVHSVDMQTPSQSKLASAVSAALVSNPGTKYVIVPQDAFVPLVASGVASAGFTNKVKVVTAGGSAAGLQAVKSGAIDYNIGQGAMYQGWIFADALVRLLAGAEVTSQVEGPVRVFTKHNVSGLDLTPDQYATATWYGTDAFTQQFKTAWGVK
jgi:ribose transport system substrate-binding protein